MSIHCRFEVVGEGEHMDIRFSADKTEIAIADLFTGKRIMDENMLYMFKDYIGETDVVYFLNGKGIFIVDEENNARLCLFSDDSVHNKEGRLVWD